MDESQPWGCKFTASIYFSGPVTEGLMMQVVDALNTIPDTNFVGVGVEIVQDEPRDQGST